jgi:hypothetical protein
VARRKLKTLLNGKKPENCVVEIELTDLAENKLRSRLFYAVPPKKMNLPKPRTENLEVEKVETGYLLSLETNGKLAKNVYLQTDEPGFFAE